MSVLEIEQPIVELSAEEFSRLIEWIEEFKADRWDKQIEEDVAAGRLDHLIRKTDEAFAAGRCMPL